MLRNIRIRYDPEEDRLILGLAVVEHDVAREHTLSVTRRVWLRARQDLQAMLDLSAEAPAQMDPSHRQMLSTAHHQAMAAQVPMHAEAALPQAPLAWPDLVLAVECGRRRDDRKWVLTFKLKGKEDLRLVLTDRTMHAMVGGLFRRESVTGWNLPALPAATPQQPPEQPARLH